MKKMRYLLFFVLFSSFFLNGLAATSARSEDLTPLLNKISKRMNSYPENNNGQYRTVTKSSEMDKNWQPKKTTVIKTIQKVVDSMSSVEVLEAVEIEDGVTKDIKQEAIEQTKEQTERANKRRAEQKDQESTENPLDELFPFSENKRAEFEFKRLNDDNINERPVFIIEAVAKEKEEDVFEGKYYIDQNTYDVLKARIKPSKNPKFVKEMDMEIEFQVLPEGHYVLRRSKVRADGRFLLKRFRMITEEERFDYKILDPKT